MTAPPIPTAIDGLLRALDLGDLDRSAATAPFLPDHRREIPGCSSALPGATGHSPNLSHPDEVVSAARAPLA